MHCFSSVFMWFHCIFTAKTCNFGTFHLNTRKPIYHTLYMKCTVFQVFSCVFTKFSLEKHVILVNFTCIQENQCIILYTWNALFLKCFFVFSLCCYCVFTAETCNFGNFHTYTRKHMYHTSYTKCTVFQVFSCVFTVFLMQKHVILVDFTCIQENSFIILYT
jgi:hypothetical protein